MRSSKRWSTEVTEREIRIERLRAFMADWLGVAFTYPDAEALAAALGEAG
jgi:hypothetical protein